MPKSIIIMCPTVLRASFEWKASLRKYAEVIKKANRAQRYIELLSGLRLYFIGETEGQRALRGFHAEIISMDEFIGVPTAIEGNTGLDKKSASGMKERKYEQS